MALIRLGTLLPDRDLRALRRYPWLGRIMPHRGPTHSFLGFLAVSGCVALPLVRLGFVDAATVFVLGWVTHLVADACTPAGIALCWPCRRHVRVLPRRFCVQRQHEYLVRGLARFVIVIAILRVW